MNPQELAARICASADFQYAVRQYVVSYLDMRTELTDDEISDHADVYEMTADMVNIIHRIVNA